MPAHTEIRELPYNCESIFDLVIDIRKYPEFLPWCLKMQVHRDEPDFILADMLIGFKFFRESFTSQVHYSRPASINIKYESGPFTYLENEWKFETVNNGHTQLKFHVDFEFRSIIFQKAIGVVFNEAVTRMVSAFETRAAELYTRNDLIS